MTPEEARVLLDVVEQDAASAPVRFIPWQLENIWLALRSQPEARQHIAALVREAALHPSESPIAELCLRAMRILVSVLDALPAERELTADEIEYQTYAAQSARQRRQ